MLRWSRSRLQTSSSPKLQVVSYKETVMVCDRSRSWLAGSDPTDSSIRRLSAGRRAGWNAAMGRWMVSLGPADDEVRDEVWPGPLFLTIEALPPDVQGQFPLLKRIQIDSSLYVDEIQVLEADAVVGVLAELRRLRRICSGQEILDGVDGRAVFDSWREWSATGERYEPGQMNEFVDAIERVLARAVEHHWRLRIEL
ncbi:hypothetical protein [Labilithrix luteola]|uniref:hypothetical protein n=1 Tax=Labilithrix luteola TaxID=1391654 RepID=UPI0011BA4CE0|nr:hypothetical protein [Labilithrix luteola]